MNNAISNIVPHKGGIRDIPLKWNQMVTGSPAKLPTYRNDTGGVPTEKPPPEIKLPSVRRIQVSKDFWLPEWASEIVDRKGTVEEMVRVALERVFEQPIEQRLLEAQAIINELNRSAENTKLIRRIVTNEKIKSLLNTRR